MTYTQADERVSGCEVQDWIPCDSVHDASAHARHLAGFRLAMPEEQEALELLHHAVLPGLKVSVPSIANILTH